MPFAEILCLKNTLLGDRFMGGLLSHLFVFDFFSKFHLDSIKNLSEVLRIFFSPKSWWKKLKKKSSDWPSRDLKSAVVTPPLI